MHYKSRTFLHKQSNGDVSAMHQSEFYPNLADKNEWNILTSKWQLVPHDYTKRTFKIRNNHEKNS